MKINVGSTDRVIRIIVGLGIIGAGIYLQNWWGAFGIILLVTGLFSRCPAYSIMKLTTCVKGS